MTICQINKKRVFIKIKPKMFQHVKPKPDCNELENENKDLKNKINELEKNLHN